MSLSKSIEISLVKIAEGLKNEHPRPAYTRGEEIFQIKDCFLCILTEKIISQFLIQCAIRK